MGLLDEAIAHAEEVAEEKEKEGKLLCNSEAGSIGCLKCAEEHRQLALWLQELKVYKSIFEDDTEGDDEDISYGYVRMKIYKEVYKK